MQIGNWKLSVRFAPGTLASEVLIYRMVGEHIELLNVREDGEVVAKRVDKGAAVAAPTLKLDEMDLRQIAVAFAEYAKGAGMPLPDESFAKGKLEAMGEHLADMRKLVFEPTITEVRHERQ